MTAQGARRGSSPLIQLLLFGASLLGGIRRDGGDRGLAKQRRVGDLTDDDLMIERGGRARYT
jgi:hypothetical protein